ncbi:hypothetical protein ACJ41O_008961 [Fusarium nematophilum]
MPATARNSHPPLTDLPAPKRRNIRKGTRSCWECKRRKARCTFENASDTICIGCSRRGSACVSQEFPEETSHARQSGERRREQFARIGKMVVQIVKEEAMAATSPELGGAWMQELEAGGLDRDVEATSRVGHTAHDTPQASDFQEATDTLPSDSGLDVPDSKPPDSPDQPAKLASSDLPTPRDATIVSQSMSRISTFFMNIMILPYNQLQLRSFQAVDVPDIYAPEAHPVLRAKKLLTLATYIQSLQPNSQKYPGKLSAPQATLVSRLMKATTACVGTKPHPAVFIEELECLMIEGVLLANGGHLQRAWIVFRQLVADAQLMGIHRPHHSAKALDPNNKLNTRFFWFRILYTERFLCLLLGLPQASTDCKMGDEEALLAEEHPVGRLERMHCVIASKLIERNDMETAHDQETRKIYRQIQRAAQCMPPRWWLAPSLAGISDDAQRFQETMRLTNQLFHNFLILQLHLPYMLRSSSSSKQNYSMTTCVNSSREVLVRFIGFRSIESVVFYCRAIDFFALMASMTLLLAHIDSHRSNKGESLAHQRPGDRALAEQAMEYMDDFNKSCQDILSKRSADVIRSLLEVEDQAFSKHDTAGNAQGDAYRDRHRLQLSIPNIGTVNISCDGITRHQEPREGFTNGKLRTSKHDGADMVTPSELTSVEPPLTAQSQDLKNQHQGADHLGSLPEKLGPGCEENVDFCFPLADDIFQGVDMAYFDHLMKGVEVADGEVAEAHASGDLWSLNDW